jgi:hypothetical protein
MLNLIQIGRAGAELRNPGFMQNWFFSLLPLTEPKPILMIDGSNDAFSRTEVPSGGHMIT